MIKSNTLIYVDLSIENSATEFVDKIMNVAQGLDISWQTFMDIAANLILKCPFFEVNVASPIESCQ